MNTRGFTLPGWFVYRLVWAVVLAVFLSITITYGVFELSDMAWQGYSLPEPTTYK